MISKELDKFYTNSDVAKLCAEIFLQYASGEIVEPSAGAGAFAPYVSLMLDLAPESEGIIEQDFLLWDTSKYKYYLGNPPFGKNSSLAKKFFNHAGKGKGSIGFILPRTFRKVSVQNSLDLNFHLKEDILLDPNSFTLDGKAYSVPCVFQVWQWEEKKRVKIIMPTSHKDFSFVNKEKADFSIRRVGVKAGIINEHNNFAAASNYFIKGDVKETFIKCENEFVAASKNTAGNPSLAKSELIHIYQQFNKNNS